MNKGMKKWAVGFLCMLMLTVVCGCKDNSQAGDLDPAYQDATVIAKVDGVEITRGQLTQRVDMLAASMAQQYQMEISKEGYPDFYETLKDAAFDDLCVGIMLDKEAKEAGFKVTDSDVEAYMDEVESYATSIGKTLDEYIQSLCATREDMEKEYKRNAFVMEKQKQFDEEIEVTDEEAQAYYEQNQAAFQTPAGIRIFHILVEDEDTAKDLIAQLNDGADFAALAQEHSIDTGSAGQGGDVGVVNESTNFVPEFKEAALALNPGEITQTPVQSTYGWHIIKAGDRVEEGIQPFEQAKAMIVYSLKNTKVQQALEDYGQELHERAEVEDMREAQDMPAAPQVDGTEAAGEETGTQEEAAQGQ